MPCGNFRTAIVTQRTGDIYANQRNQFAAQKCDRASSTVQQPRTDRGGHRSNKELAERAISSNSRWAVSVTCEWYIVFNDLDY